MTSEIALESGVGVPDDQCFGRCANNWSSLKTNELKASKQIKGDRIVRIHGRQESDDCRYSRFVYARNILFLCQGQSPFDFAKDQRTDWNINLGEVSRIWKGGSLFALRSWTISNMLISDAPICRICLLGSGFRAWMRAAQPNWATGRDDGNAIRSAVRRWASSLNYYIDMYPHG